MSFIKQVSYFMELIFNFKATIIITSDQIIINLPNPLLSGSVLPVCYGAQMISIFIGIILVTPSSHNYNPKLNIVRRKIIIIILTIISTYLLYLLRMVLMLGFAQYGIPMHVIHDSSYYFVTLISFIVILYIFRKILPEFIVFLHYIGYSISNRKICNSTTEKVNPKKRNNLIIELTVVKKEIYYPFLGVTVCTSILYIVSLFLYLYGNQFFHININLYEIILPLLLALYFLIRQYLLDIFKKSSNLKLIISVFVLVLIIVLLLFVLISIQFLINDILNIITIVIYYFSVIIIHFFFREEVKNYLLIERI
ncbi:MAG: hypothetical protein ACFFA4_15655 [Promethearchaeota archaeon]